MTEIVSNPDSPPGVRRSRSTPGRSVLRQWRDWRIPVKLAAVTLVPAVFAIVLGALQIGSQIDRADTYRQIDRLVTVNDTLHKTVTWLQRERTKASVLLTSGSREIAFEVLTEQRQADSARDELIKAAAGLSYASETTGARYADVLTRFGELDVLRGRVGAREIDGPTALDGYTLVIRSLIAFDRAAAEEVADPALSGTAGALHDLEAAKEEVYYQQGLVGVGLARGGLTGQEIDALRASEARLGDRTADFRALADPAQQAEYDRTLTEADLTSRANLVQLVMGGRPGAAPPIGGQDWNTASDLVSGKLSDVSATLGTQIRNGSAELQDSASDAAGIASVVLILALVLAAAIMFVIGRQLLGSLSALRRGALDIAERGLPAAVARIRDGKDPVVPTVEPVAVATADEVGQVARAFDAVHQEALRLATEQAGMRANYAGVFVNLARRSQGLVQRQLQLLERLERDEEDADQLATLFQLDHLATRMRRNNENLMVLSGSVAGEHQARRAQQPVSLSDLLRAAVSEVEQYQRVVITSPPTVLVVGYAVGDLVRLTAELLDNAAAFSAPATQVVISSHHTEGGAVRIEVCDRGIGMKPDEMAEANGRLAEDGVVDATTSRRMGLFVVGRLAARHGVNVRLRPGTPSGLRATVVVPAELVTSNVVALPSSPATQVLPPADNAHGNGSGGTGQEGGGQPGNGPRSNGSAVNGSRVNGSTVNGSSVNGTNGSKVNGTNGSGGNATANGLPRRSIRSGVDALSALTRGDGAQLPEQFPVPRDAVDTMDPLPEPPAAEQAAWPSHPVPTGLAEDAPAEALFDPVVPVEDAKAAEAKENTAPPAPVAPSLPESAAETTGWWDTTVIYERAPGAPVDRGIQETTPIFDEMVSAWFRAVTDDPNSTAADVAMPQAWDFAADQGFQAAQAVSRAEPEDYTRSGLPRRTPRRNLVPGSAEPKATTAPPVAERDAEDLRTRLSNYQRGVHRARGAHHTGPAHGRPEIQPGLDLRGAQWRFAADSGWAAAEQVTTSTSDTTTDGSLPRRTPRERLLPGSLDPAPGPQVRVERDADALRDRLGSLQRGVGRGRESLARQAGEQDHGSDV
ncbi:sensor histidine kinase [Actinokineospora xionganensis]|uniref:histidine kinase n=1 Tax=Actinokineospora xionganensis TaxID=2684470 RepID=A0ABR7L660_9PSEU|nr:nitrate- and nitrite sensing domain-containing protein [Actinokineospora xionganensis]MBC6447832.1 nitrate- and nitrite sensing domain-containing protein [Actinokineospora xionganensis]